MDSESKGTTTPFLMRHAGLWLIPLSLLLGVLLVEGFLRLFPSVMPVVAQQRILFLTKTGAPKSIGDPYLGFTYPPFFKTKMVSRDFSFVVESDEHGFRNSTPWPKTAEIVVAGDSMAYGYGVASEQAWTALVAESLPSSNLISLGLPGAVPRQYTRYFEKFGIPLHPKVLIYTIFAGNDILEEAVFDRWLAAGSPGNYDVWRFFQGRVPLPGTSLLQRSYLVQSLKALWRGLGGAFSSTTINLADGGRIQLYLGQYDSSVAVNQPNRPGFDSVVRTTKEARDLAHAIGCQTVILLVPVKEKIYAAALDRDFPGLTEHLQQALDSAGGMTVINPTDYLTALAAQGKTLYFEVDGHPNAFGNKAIADFVTQYLRENAETLGLGGRSQASTPPEAAPAS